MYYASTSTRQLYTHSVVSRGLACHLAKCDFRSVFDLWVQCRSTLLPMTCLSDLGMAFVCFIFALLAFCSAVGYIVVLFICGFLYPWHRTLHVEKLWCRQMENRVFEDIAREVVWGAVKYDYMVRWLRVCRYLKVRYIHSKVCPRLRSYW